MRKHSWLFGLLGVLALILVACVASQVQIPTAPRLNLPPGSEISAGEFNVTGSGVPGSEVQVLVDGEVVGATQVGEDGTWSMPISLAEPGEYQITVQSRYRVEAITYDLGGDVFAQADPVTVNVSRGVGVEMTPPSLELSEGDTELVAGAVLLLSGRGTPGTQAQILVDGAVVGVAPVGEDGTWSLATTVAEAGEHVISVRTLDASGAVVAEAEPVPISLALPVTIERVPPSLELPAVEMKAGTIVLTGSSEPDSEVQLLVDGEAVGTAQVDTDGNWSLEVTDVDAGEHEIIVQALDARGDVVAEAEAVALSVTETEEAEAVAEEAETEEAEAVAEEAETEEAEAVVEEAEAVTEEAETEEAEAAAEEAETEEAEAVAEEAETEEAEAAAEQAETEEAETMAMVLPVLELPAAGAEVEPGIIELIGTGEPVSAVQILVDGGNVGTTQVDEDGTWSLEISMVEGGEHEIIVQALDASGEVVDEAEPVALFLAELAAESAMLPVLELPETGSLDAGPVTLSGSAEPNMGVQILADGQVAGLVWTDDNGDWSLEVTLPQGGEHEIKVQTFDLGGEVIAEAEPVTVSLNGTAELSAPAIQEQATQAEASDLSAALGPYLVFPADGADIITGEIIVGRLTLIGRGEPGTKVEILDGPDVVGTASVDAQGDWHYTYEPPKGRHQYTVRLLTETPATDGTVNARVATPAEGIDCNTNPGINRVTTYVVGTCDTLSGIGVKTGVSLDAVIAANPQFEDPDLIFPGDFVTIPE